MARFGIIRCSVWFGSVWRAESNRGAIVIRSCMVWIFFSIINIHLFRLTIKVGDQAHTH